MDRIEQTLVTQRKQIADLHEAMAAQSAINKAIRSELEGLGMTLITHGDALEETVSRIETIQAKLDEHDAVITNPPVWEASHIDTEPFVIDSDPSTFFGSAAALNELPPAPAPAKKSEAQIEAEKLEKAKAKADKALGVRP